MAKFKVVLERVETITKQGAVIVEARTAEEARRVILADLEVDQGSYDGELQPVEHQIGDVMVMTVEDQHQRRAIPRAMTG
jgi:hypothetical protein